MNAILKFVNGEMLVTIECTAAELRELVAPKKSKVTRKTGPSFAIHEQVCKIDPLAFRIPDSEYAIAVGYAKSVRYIEAIKEIRAKLGCALKDAKPIVDKVIWPIANGVPRL